ncbi:MAG TPA: glycosyltransferase [Devosia sp.]|jgi:glycosyltransferase involved in cell wall biosynthesis|nr:glycosyltransferase [Devosia sp.]
MTDVLDQGHDDLRTQSTDPVQADGAAGNTVIDLSSLLPRGGTRPMASVIMATNKSPEAIAPALRALQEQTYRPMEIVVAVDRPVSDPEKLVFQKLYPGVIFEFLGEVRRIPVALNAAIARSSGALLVRCDDDDVCLPDRVEKQYRLLVTKRLDFVWSQATGKREGDEGGWLIDCPDDDEEIKRALLGRNVLVHSTLTGWKAAFARIGNYNPGFYRAQDLELYLRAMRGGLKFGAVKEQLVERYYSAGSVTVRHRKNQIMYSFAARVLHAAHTNDAHYLVGVTLRYMLLLLTPNWVRSLVRTLSRMTGRGR